MEKTIKISFPQGGGTGYVFAAFKIKASAEKAIEFLKQEGDFLCLDEKFYYAIFDTRIIKSSIINGEVVIKIKYKYSNLSSCRAAGEADARAVVYQIENLLEYAEKILN